MYSNNNNFYNYNIMEYQYRGSSVCERRFDDNTTFCEKLRGDANVYLDCVDQAKEIKKLCDHREERESRNYN